MIINANNIPGYTTKDNSEIRELLHPDNSDVLQQSLAEATVKSKQITSAHFHKFTEEIYYILSGYGTMFLDDKSFNVKAGDSILIKPGQVHCIENTGNNDLKFLCCCAPAYQHDDTYLVNNN